MMNKERGYLTARVDARSKTVMDSFPPEDKKALFPIGRLDKDTEGLLLITDDGTLFQRLTSPDSKIAKTYYFVAIGEISDEEAAKIESGVKIYANRDFVTSPARVRIESRKTLSDFMEFLSEEDTRLAKRKTTLPAISGTVEITEGKKHQVRRMIGHAGCRVVYLKRIKIGNLPLDESIPLGSFRPLTEDEVMLLK